MPQKSSNENLLIKRPPPSDKRIILWGFTPYSFAALVMPINDGLLQTIPASQVGIPGFSTSVGVKIVGAAAAVRTTSQTGKFLSGSFKASSCETTKRSPLLIS